jgi:hypothetical protein
VDLVCAVEMGCDKHIYTNRELNMPTDAADSTQVSLGYIFD